MLNETKQKLIEVINNSGLPPEIVEMVLENLILTIRLQYQNKEGSSDGTAES